MNGRLFRFGYTNPPGEGRIRLHMVRDGSAFSELASGLFRRGCDYGTVMHNYPNHGLGADAFRFLKQGDLVVLVTRPPLSDYLGDPTHEGEDKDKRYMKRSDDHLEKAIFADLRRFFKYVSRYHVELAPEVAVLLPKPVRLMAALNFHTKGKATIRSMEVPAGEWRRNAKPPKDYNSVGYFLHLDQISGYPCGLLASFSMGGYENLLWNRMVRLRFERWLDKPVFAFAGLKLPEEPRQPLTPEFADDAPATVLIEHWLGPAK